MTINIPVGREKGRKGERQKGDLIAGNPGIRSGAAGDRSRQGKEDPQVLRCRSIKESVEEPYFGPGSSFNGGMVDG
jgi:hypothetical protein